MVDLYKSGEKKKRPHVNRDHGIGAFFGALAEGFFGIFSAIFEVIGAILEGIGN